MENENKKMTMFRINENERIFLKVIGDGNMSDGLKEIMKRAGFSDDEKEFKKAIKSIKLEQIKDL